MCTCARSRVEQFCAVVTECEQVISHFRIQYITCPYTRSCVEHFLTLSLNNTRNNFRCENNTGNSIQSGQISFHET